MEARPYCRSDNTTRRHPVLEAGRNVVGAHHRLHRHRQWHVNQRHHVHPFGIALPVHPTRVNESRNSVP